MVPSPLKSPTSICHGLKYRGVMVWAVPDPYDQVTDIAPVWAMNPDIIATDRNDFFQYVALPQPF